MNIGWHSGSCSDSSLNPYLAATFFVSSGGKTSYWLVNIDMGYYCMDCMRWPALYLSNYGIYIKKSNFFNITEIHNLLHMLLVCTVIPCILFTVISGRRVCGLFVYQIGRNWQLPANKSQINLQTCRYASLWWQQFDIDSPNASHGTILMWSLGI